MKNLNEIEPVDAFEIIDIEEKLDFKKAGLGTGCPCDNGGCYDAN